MKIPSGINQPMKKERTKKKGRKEINKQKQLVPTSWLAEKCIRTNVVSIMAGDNVKLGFVKVVSSVMRTGRGSLVWG